MGDATIKAPKNINILPVTQSTDDAVKNRLNEHINRVDECYRLLRSDLAKLEPGDDSLDDIYVRRDGTSTYTGTGVGYKDEDGMISDSDVATASQQSVKAYVDSFWTYILASPLGTIFYLWEDWDGKKFIERLIPGQYGQVLTTGGANQRPFWSWVWEEPGADFGGRIYFRVWMYAYPIEASIITMDVTKTVQAGGLTSIRRDDKTNPDYFHAYHPEFETSLLDSSVITMDVTNEIEISMVLDTSDFIDVT